MLKILSLTVVFSTLVIPLLPEIVWTRPIIIKSQYPELQTADLDSANCYFQTADGRILNLDRLCGKSSQNQNNPSSTESAPNPPEARTEPLITPPAPVNNSGNNGGNQPCFGLDQNGRPCGS